MFKTGGAGVKGFLNNAKTTALFVGESTLSSNNENTTPSQAGGYPFLCLWKSELAQIPMFWNIDFIFQFDEWSIWNRWPWIRITQADNLFVVFCFINKYSYTIFWGVGGMRGVHCTNEITHRYKIEACVLEDIKCIKLTLIWLKGCIFCEISQKNVSIFPFFLFYYFLSFMKCKSSKDQMGRIDVWLLLI